jgi:PAS domain S-box-containing protein
MSARTEGPFANAGTAGGLHASARLLSLIYENTSDPVYLVAVQDGGRYEFVAVNPSFLYVSGYREDQVLGAPMERVVPAANVPLVRSQYERAIARREPVVYEEHAELPAGTRHAEITLIPIFEEAGSVTHILADIRDVTARTVAEQEREALLSATAFLSDATRLLASLDIERALGDVAQLAVPYLGDGCAVDLLGDGEPRRVAAIVRDPQVPMFAGIHPTVLGGHAILYRELETHCIGVPLLIKARLVGAITLRAAPGRAYGRIDLGLVEELGRRAALAIENAQLYRNAEAALRARDELLMIAAHEIRGPITSIHLAVQALLQKRLQPAVSARALELIEREDRRLCRFIDELLDLGRLGTGQLQLQLEDVDLATVVQDVVGRLGGELAASGSTVTVTAESSVVGEWDRFRVEQVVTNLLTNAIKFGLGNPIELTVAGVAGRARLAIRDHGIGIEPASQQRIFLPFERNVSVRHYGGLGLGLHIVSTTVGAMGGTIAVESAPGAGATFVVELPLRPSESADAHPRH